MYLNDSIGYGIQFPDINLGQMILQIEKTGNNF